jgi:hypothetical protein
MNGRVPVGAAVCTILGAFFIFLGGLLEATFIAIFAAFTPGPHGFAHGFEIAGLSVGVLIGVMGLLMLVTPELSKVWGALTILLAIVSLVVALLGGFLVGFVLAVIGGALAISFPSNRPSMSSYPPLFPGGMPPPPPPPPPPPQ